MESKSQKNRSGVGRESIRAGRGLVRLLLLLVAALTAGLAIGLPGPGRFEWPTRAVLADTRPSAEDRGISGLILALRRLPTIASVLHTAAHPDDESTELLAYLARGEGARVAYLSLNRGEGGQDRKSVV